MRKITALICALLLTASLASCGEDSPETPADNPEFLPQEEWDLSFNNYVHTGYDRDFCIQEGWNYHRKVIIARGKDILYIKGIFKKYPDSWIRGIVKDNKLSFDSLQVLGYENGAPVYFHWGSSSMEMSFGNTYAMYNIGFDPNDLLPLEVSDDGKTMSVECVKRGGHLNEDYKYYNGAFWYNEDAEGIDGCVKYTKWYYTEEGEPCEDTTPFPEKDFMINMCFTKTE